MELIKLINISKTYEGKSVRTEVLQQINLSIEKGEFVCVLGKSGCGKTTLLNILGLIDKASSGKYVLENIDTTDLAAYEIAQIRNQKIGFIFQSFYLLDDYNVLDNVILPMGYAGKKKVEREKQARHLLDKVGMTHRVKYYPNQLSGGEKQRVAIARALSNSPKLILADEPTGNLDKKNCDVIMGILKELNSTGITIIMVTHDQTLRKYATRTIEISDGMLREIHE